MDFVTGLPNSERFNTILVVVDCLTKMRHLIPCNETTIVTELAPLNLDHLWKHHGLLEIIVLDEAPQFTTAFWLELCRLLKVQPRLSTAFHSETDRQTERANAVMEQYLCSYVSYQ